MSTHDTPLPCGGRAGDALHHADGTMRTTAPTTGKRALDRFHAASAAHAPVHARTVRHG